MSSFTLNVAAPPQRVFDYLSEPRHRPEWQSSLRAVELDDDGPTGVGTRWIDRTAVGARPRMEIVEMHAAGPSGAPGVWSEVGRWRGLCAELTLHFHPHPRGTRVEGTVEVSGSPWPARLVLQALAPPAVRADLRRAARILEQR
ncbi:SRPBCC family protein [Nocardioides panacihumi]